MLCNRERIPEFTAAQIAECEKCKHISGKKIWCCKFGVYIREHERIIVPKQMPSVGTMAKGFVREGAKYLKAGRPKRSEVEQTACRLICVQCGHYQEKSKLGPRCSKCGCCVNLKTRWATAHCPEGLW